MKPYYHEEKVYGLRNLSVNLLGMRLENPFLLAAGPSTDDVAMVRRAFDCGWAGAVLKTTSVVGTRVDLAYPMLSAYGVDGATMAGLGNIDLISRRHVDEVEGMVRLLKREYPEKLVAASIMAGRKDDWQTLVERLESAGVDLIECSFSCPQGNLGEHPGRMIAQSASQTERTARWVKEATHRIPVSIKITPHVTDIVEIALAVKRSGADAITASNSLQALLGVDLHSFVPYPQLGGSSTYSGLTGPAIKPITLKTIAEIARHVDIPILGTGGASTWRDAVEFMAVGAQCVEFCTVVLQHGFGVVRDLRSGLSHYLDEMGFDAVASIVGRALPHIVAHDALPRRRMISRIHEARCILCERCYVACRDGGHGAIERRESRIPVVSAERCVGCGLCAEVCPVNGCITIDPCPA